MKSAWGKKSECCNKQIQFKTKMTFQRAILALLTCGVWLLMPGHQYAVCRRCGNPCSIRPKNPPPEEPATIEPPTDEES